MLSHHSLLLMVVAVVMVMRSVGRKNVRHTGRSYRRKWTSTKWNNVFVWTARSSSMFATLFLRTEVIKRRRGGWVKRWTSSSARDPFERNWRSLEKIESLDRWRCWRLVFCCRSETNFTNKFVCLFSLTQHIQSVSGIKINEARWLFMGQFWPLLNQSVFLEVAGAVFKIDSSLKVNHQIWEMLCITFVQNNARILKS